MIKQFITAILEDNKSITDSVFNNLLMSRVNTSLDIKRVELASTLYVANEAVSTGLAQERTNPKFREAQATIVAGLSKDELDSLKDIVGKEVSEKDLHGFYMKLLKKHKYAASDKMYIAINYVLDKINSKSESVNESAATNVTLVFKGKCDTDELLMDEENEFITVEDVKKVGNFIVVVPMHLEAKMSIKEMTAVREYAKWANDKYNLTYHGTNVSIATDILKSIARDIRPDSKDDIEFDGKFAYLGLRKYDYFTARRGEEDDDHPKFTGFEKARAIATKALSQYDDLYKLDIGGDEKAWFTVSLKLNESVINEGHDIPWLDVVYDELGKENANAIEKACKTLRLLLSTRDYTGLHHHIYVFDAHKGFLTKELNSLLKDNKDDSNVVGQLRIIAKASKIKLTEDLDESVANPNNFELLVKAIGYETTTMVVKAATQSEATKNYKREAFRKFAKHNDISMGDAIGFGSLSVSKTKKDVTEDLDEDSSKIITVTKIDSDYEPGETDWKEFANECKKNGVTATLATQPGGTDYVYRFKLVGPFDKVRDIVVKHYDNDKKVAEKYHPEIKLTEDLDEESILEGLHKVQVFFTFKDKEGESQMGSYSLTAENERDAENKFNLKFDKEYPNQKATRVKVDMNPDNWKYTGKFVIDEAIEDLITFFDIINRKSSKAGANFDHTFDELNSVVRDYNMEQLDYDKLYNVFYNLRPDKLKAKNLLIRLISKYADDTNICKQLNLMATLAGIKGI